MNVSTDDLLQEIAELRAHLRVKEDELVSLKRENQIQQSYGLNNEEVARYSRQMILPEIGVEGQVKLKTSSVLIVGAGGLGCPAILYLASSGIGCIGIVDYDNVEINNLHRQVLFSESNIGKPKVLAVAETINRINSSIKIIPYEMQLNSYNATNVIKDFDIVIDATDNVATRYLLNDACVLNGKSLISASALKFEGHMSVFNHNDGPCYRCIFPTPPAPENVTSCGDGGVFGPAVGTLGVLQALEAIKVLLGKSTLSGRLLFFDAMEMKFRNIKLRSKNSQCAICGENPTIKELIDYEQFCGAKANDKNTYLKLLTFSERISCKDLKEEMKNPVGSVLIDVRAREEFEICKLNRSLNIPLKELEKEENINVIKNEIQLLRTQTVDPVKVFVICRRGNDSQKAVKLLQKTFTNDSSLEIKDIIGGLHSWSRDIDHTIPIY